MALNSELGASSDNTVGALASLDSVHAAFDYPNLSLGTMCHFLQLFLGIGDRCVGASGCFIDKAVISKEKHSD